MGTAVAARLTRWSPPEQVGLAMLLDQRSERCVPGRALLLSLAALAVPVVGALRFPEALGEQGALLWLLALVPAFLQAYHRGWRGVATALAVGMATLSSTQAIVLWRGLAVPDLLLGVVVAYLAIALGIGWIAELLHRQRAEVEDLALTDLLTHLPNRRHARVFLDNEFAAAARGRLLSVVLFDLDRFKQFNDRYGHPAGDEALQAFAEVLAHTTRRSNLSARFGGEEFVSILAGSDGEGAVVFAERVRSGLQARHLGDDPLTVSAGVACHQPAMSSPDELLAAADEALYEAKDAGRNCVRLYAGTPPEAVAGHLPDSLITDSFGPADSYPRADTEIGKTPPPPELLPDPGPPFGTGHRALLVEDEASVRELIATYLRREGFAVTSAASVAEGVRALKEEFDVVVTDIHLPGSSGRDLVAAVKSRWPVTQVLVMTGLQDAQVAAQALDAGADRYLFKPFGLPELRTHLLDALSRRERLLQERARKQDLSGDARERQAQTRKAVIKGAQALVRAVEERDPFTRGHATRVARYSAILAAAVDPDGSSLPLDALDLGSELHDVGKIAVADGTLNKVGPLEPAEIAEIRLHPGTGRRIVQPLLDDDIVLSIVSWHHERWDGSGYPDGLAGESIPLAARLVALTDSLDAMTSPRAYRPARSWDDAVREIRREAGRQFDPSLMGPFDAVLDEMRRVYEEGEPDQTA